MYDEKRCPFQFGNSLNNVYCCKSKCALWVEDVESSACGLAYQSLLDAKIREQLVRTRRYMLNGDGDA